MICWPFAPQNTLLNPLPLIIHRLFYMQKKVQLNWRSLNNSSASYILYICVSNMEKENWYEKYGLTTTLLILSCHLTSTFKQITPSCHLLWLLLMSPWWFYPIFSSMKVFTYLYILSQVFTLVTLNLDVGCVSLVSEKEEQSSSS